MSPFRPLVDLLAQLWFSLDAANALRHGNPVSERARAHCMAESARNAPTADSRVPA